MKDLFKKFINRINTKEGLKQLEGLGLLLLLLSFFIQIYENDIESEVQETKNYNIHKKLDDIWQVTAKLYEPLDLDKTSVGAINFKNSVQGWTIYSQDRKNLENWQEAVFFKLFTKSRIWLFIIGSFLVIIPKFIKER